MTALFHFDLIGPNSYSLRPHWPAHGMEAGGGRMRPAQLTVSDCPMYPVIPPPAGGGGGIYSGTGWKQATFGEFSTKYPPPPIPGTVSDKQVWAAAAVAISLIFLGILLYKYSWGAASRDVENCSVIITILKKRYNWNIWYLRRLIVTMNFQKDNLAASLIPNPAAHFSFVSASWTKAYGSPPYPTFYAFTA